MSRTLPNIIITGTPGTGKTTHCEDLAEKVPELKHLSVNQVVKDKGCHEGWDEDYQSWIVDEEKVRLMSLFSYGGARPSVSEDRVLISFLGIVARCHRRRVQSRGVHH